MKFTVTFKTPDAVDEAISELPEEDQQEAREACEAFFEYDEYVQVEVDTKKTTCTVLPVCR